MAQDKEVSQVIGKNIDAWFNKNESQLIRTAMDRANQKKEQERLRQEKEGKSKLIELHWMKCPKCGHDMEIKIIEKIEVDKCSNCKGIYFDAGELDELLLKKAEERISFFRILISPVLIKKS
ncbi:zf-TFIIB domain-containing protein [candidate division KSB1 bacterium]